MGGFVVARNQGDTDYTGKVETYSVAAAHATLLAPGDVVVLTGTADTEGRAEVDAGAASASITGVIAAVEPIFAGEQLQETGLPALTAGKVHVHIDPNQAFEADVENGPLVVANVGLNGDAVFNVATKSGGLTISNMTFNATGVATTNTLQFRIVKLLEDDAGVLGNRVLVRLNNTTMAAGTTGK